MLDGNGNRCLAVKRHPSGQHFKHSDTKGIDIALFIGISASCLLRRGVVNRSHHIGSNRVAGGCLGNSEIRYLYLTFLGNNNILRLDIAVNNVIIVGSFYPHADLNGDTDGLFYRKSGFLLNVFFESDSLHQFHYNIVDSLFLSYIIHIHDIGMCQPCCCLCFNPEFRNKVGIFTEFLF